jgi:hypothetical protein
LLFTTLLEHVCRRICRSLPLLVIHHFAGAHLQEKLQEPSTR